MIERKCTKCNKWNGEEDFCKYCGNPISLKEITRIEEEIKQEKIRIDKKPPSNFFVWTEKMKHSKNILVKSFYYVIYSVWLLVMGIGAFFAWLIAWASA